MTSSSAINLYPLLTAEALLTLSGYAARVFTSSNSQLVKRTDTTFHLFIVLSGELGIYDSHDHLLRTLGPGNFIENQYFLAPQVDGLRVMSQQATELLSLTTGSLRKMHLHDKRLVDMLLKTLWYRRVFESTGRQNHTQLLGSRYSIDTFKIREFLSKNNIDHQWIDPDTDAYSRFLRTQFDLAIAGTPVLAHSQSIWSAPSLGDLAHLLALSHDLDEQVYDLIIVGAGPAGLAASVYAASEGLQVLTVDSIGPGGQAGTSSMIENYLGFPKGISGSELANNAYLQARKFGCTLSVPHQVVQIATSHPVFTLALDSGQLLRSRAVIAATGARYMNPPCENMKSFEGRGVYFGASKMEAETMKGKAVLIIGGGNSAGQAALYLAEKCPHIHLVIRGTDLHTSMSAYLITRISRTQNISVHARTEIRRLYGTDWLEQVLLEDTLHQREYRLDISDLFLFLGSVPCSEWLQEATCLDSKGFVMTGAAIPKNELKTYHWPHTERPQSLETCVPGLFAVGDLRSGSVKRVASAAGEGAMAVSQLHTFLSHQHHF